jgi:hypothetical protein
MWPCLLEQRVIHSCFFSGVVITWPPLWSSGQSSRLQNRDVLCFLWGTNWIYICYAEESRPPLWSSGQSSWLQNRDVLCFLWGTNWIYICYVEESRPPLLSSGQSSWLHNGDVLCFLWCTNWIYVCYVEESRPPRGGWLESGGVSLCIDVSRCGSWAGVMVISEWSEVKWSEVKWSEKCFLSYRSCSEKSSKLSWQMRNEV